jgi:hypothetical protein
MICAMNEKMLSELNPVQRLAYKLIQSDAHFIYSLTKLNGKIDSNFVSMSVPYIGIFADGAKQWGQKVGLDTLVFTPEEKSYYGAIRAQNKLFDLKYQDFYELLWKKFIESDQYFSNICKPIAQKLKLYDNFGVDVCSNHFCGNTILCSIYTPIFDYYTSVGEKIKQLSVVAGQLCAAYGGNRNSQVHFNEEMNFSHADYNFFSHCPIKGTDFNTFCLFSILCSVNYLLLFVDKFFVEDSPSKLRFAYVQYYYLVNQVAEINEKLSTNFEISNRLVNDRFRNCMAHYGLGSEMTELDIVQDDSMGGLTIKFFGTSYNQTKLSVYAELEKLAVQLEEFLF